MFHCKIRKLAAKKFEALATTTINTRNLVVAYFVPAFV
jgi:hypothetical protein